MSSSDARAWVPALWDAPPREAPAESGAFTPGWVVGGETDDSRVRGSDGPRPLAGPTHAGAQPSSPFLALPDFGAARPTTPADALRRAAAAAADAREAELRTEFEAAWAAEAEALGAQAAADAEAAYHQGVTEGRAAGADDARAELAAAGAALDAAAAEVRAHATRWTADLQAHVAALAVAVAHHVIGRTAARDAAIVTDLVARAVAEFPADQALVARVHPDDVRALKTAWAEAPRTAELRWIPDAAVTRGGALVEGRERIVDGRVDTALERLYRTLSGHQA